MYTYLQKKIAKREVQQMIANEDAIVRRNLLAGVQDDAESLHVVRHFLSIEGGAVSVEDLKYVLKEMREDREKMAYEVEQEKMLRAKLDACQERIVGLHANQQRREQKFLENKEADRRKTTDLDNRSLEWHLEDGAEVLKKPLPEVTDDALSFLQVYTRGDDDATQLLYSDVLAEAEKRGMSTMTLAEIKETVQLLERKKSIARQNGPRRKHRRSDPGRSASSSPRHRREPRTSRDVAAASTRSSDDPRREGRRCDPGLDGTSDVSGSGGASRFSNGTASSLPPTDV